MPKLILPGRPVKAVRRYRLPENLICNLETAMRNMTNWDNASMAMFIQHRDRHRGGGPVATRCPTLPTTTANSKPTTYPKRGAL